MYRTMRSDFSKQSVVERFFCVKSSFNCDTDIFWSCDAVTGTTVGTADIREEVPYNTQYQGKSIQFL